MELERSILPPHTLFPSVKQATAPSNSGPGSFDSASASGQTHPLQLDDSVIKIVVRNVIISAPKTLAGAQELLGLLQLRKERCELQKHTAQKRINELIQFLNLVRTELSNAEGHLAEADNDLQRAKHIVEGQRLVQGTGEAA
uniref:Mediator of RNA polymerase II transcription subunit 7 n=1 Tax=Mycena chlorophos TaxID=658473 RepID=A0ABQ0L400_MYCCL|nr:predicted protein [Mycena chlorophos]